VGTGHAAGVWEQQPKDRPEFRAQYRKQLAKQAAVRSTAEDGI
jgi:chlorophyllide a reductase subunit Y